MPHRIATADLTRAVVPADVVVGTPDPGGSGPATGAAGLDEVVAFALTFNGYAWGGGPQAVGDRIAPLRDAWQAGRDLPGSVDHLRAALFLWSRAHQHAGSDPVSAQDADWLNTVLAALRDRLPAPTGPA